MTEKQARDEIAALGKSLFDRGLTAGSSGNISVRIDSGWLLTPTNACLGRLDPERISRLDTHGKLVSGDKPSKEEPLHLAMYHERPSAGAVVHLHSTYSAAVSCLHGLNASNCIPPYHRPGDPKLGDAIRVLAKCNSAVLLANHGPVVSGPTLEAAVYAIEELEETAKLFLLLKGQDTRPLDAAQIEELRDVFGLSF
jgi:3-dehydro-4-phosphotetronate decarboxylase